MIYISGQNDSLAELQAREGIPGSLDEYRRKLAELNPELFRKLPKDIKQLPPYTPIYLVTVPKFDMRYSAEIARIVQGYSTLERQTIRNMQEADHDIATSVTTMDLMEDFQTFLSDTKKTLSEPIIATPVYEFNRSLTQKSWLKMSAETLKYAGDFTTMTRGFSEKNKLFELMRQRDLLNHEFLELRGLKGSAAAAARRKLEGKTKELTAQIKKLIPKHVAASAKKNILGLKPEDAAKVRANSTSLKLAKKGVEQIKTTHLDRLTTSGLARLQKMVKGFKVMGDGVKKFATYTNYGLATYSIAEAYAKGGNVARTAFREGTSLYAGTLLSAAAGGGLATLGGIAIGTLAGDAALGAAILVCYPVIGWVVLIVAGAAVAGYISYQTKEVSERVWDAFESGYVKEKALQLGSKIFDEFKYLGEELMKYAP